MAPLLLLGLLFTTGLVLWSTGQNLTVLAEGKSVSPETAVIVFVGLTLSVATVTGVNWRIWGNPIGTLAASLGLLAVWLIYAARIVLQHKPPWLTSAVELVAVVLLIVIALSVQWDWAL
jgi:putative Mn2+ efflux pump MntP